MRFYRSFAAVLLAGFTLFHLWYIAAGVMNLAPDEAYYWEWSRRLDWSYYSKGPMVAWLIALTTRLGTDTEFFVRLPAVLLGTGTATLVYILTARIFRSARAAFFAVVICGSMPLFVAGSILMTIDAPLVFFWTLALYSLFAALEENGRGRVRWALLGLALGLGFLAKYTILLFFLCCGVYGLFVPASRRCLKTAGPYLAVAVTFVLALPVVVWNWRHDWASFLYVLERTGVTSGSRRSWAATAGEFLGAQIAITSPLLFWALGAAMVRAGRAGLRGNDASQLFLFAFSIPLLAFFLLWSFYAPVEANWAACAYITGTVACAGWWDQLMSKAQNGPAKLRLAGVFVLVLLPGLALSGVAHFPQTLDSLGIRLPLKLDPTARLQGWKELGTAVGEILANEGKDFVLVSHTYQIASEVAFYVPGRPRVYSVNLGRSINQYDIWGGLEEIKGRDLLFLTDDEEPAARLMAANCEEMQKREAIETSYRGQRGRSFSVFVCRRYAGPRP